MELKDKIINSAYELFSVKGYERTAIEEIIKQAECSKGGFYHHFKSKEEILKVIVTNYMDDLTKYLERIVSDDKDSFADKFNDIFLVISQYKLKQITEWSKVNNVFSFSGNDRILRQLEQQFKIAATRTYFEVLRSGKEQGKIRIEYPEIIAELCTRVILWIYESAGKLIESKDARDQARFENLLDFSEGIISHALDMKKQEIKFKDVALSYLHKAKEYYLANKEERR